MVADTRTANSSSAVRALNQPKLLAVKTDTHGLPKALNLRGRWADVDAIADEWRIEDEWWRERPVSRMYYECVMAYGMRVTVFHDFIVGHWYIQKA